MKTIFKSLLIVAFLSGFTAYAQENNVGTPNDAVANPSAGSHEDADVKGSVTPPTQEQKENVEQPAKKAHSKKAKATHAKAAKKHKHSGKKSAKASGAKKKKKKKKTT